MYGLKKLLVEEVKKYQTIRQEADKRLCSAPPGNLRITSSGKTVQFMQCTEGNLMGSYIKKADKDLVKALAQKGYDLKILRLTDKRLKEFEKLIKEYDDMEIEDIFNKMHPVRKKLVTPADYSYEQRLEKWKSVPYKGKPFKEGQSEIYTKKGERVRSKSEKILADMFSDHGVEYKYESPLNLSGYGIVYPDYTFLSKKTYEEIYWEHNGKMDDPEYAQKAIKKIDLYVRNGIIPGKRLIITYESSSYALNTSVAEKLIMEYLR